MFSLLACCLSVRLCRSGMAEVDGRVSLLSVFESFLIIFHAALLLFSMERVFSMNFLRFSASVLLICLVSLLADVLSWRL